jgi:protein ImuA
MQPFDASLPYSLDRARSRAAVVEELRRLLPRMESTSAATRAFPFGLPALDAHLPQGGLASGALHEVAPAAGGDMPTAFGFVAALLGRMPPGRPILLVSSPKGLADYGRPHAHGLNRLGLDPARVILVETADERQALWAMEEALRSAVPAAVAGVIGTELDLRTSQRLHLAAGDSGRLLVLLPPAGAAGSSAAVTRWRVSAAAAARDRFGLIARRRWHGKLERCRNGRPGEWLVEFDHAAHRFSLATALADPAVSGSAGAQSLARAG